jgi:hypothetical protein
MDYRCYFACYNNFVGNSEPPRSDGVKMDQKLPIEGESKLPDEVQSEQSNSIQSETHLPQKQVTLISSISLDVLGYIAVFGFFAFIILMGAVPVSRDIFALAFLAACIYFLTQSIRKIFFQNMEYAPCGVSGFYLGLGFFIGAVFCFFMGHLDILSAILYP